MKRGAGADEGGFPAALSQDGELERAVRVGSLGVGAAKHGDHGVCNSPHDVARRARKRALSRRLAQSTTPLVISTLAPCEALLRWERRLVEEGIGSFALLSSHSCRLKPHTHLARADRCPLSAPSSLAFVRWLPLVLGNRNARATQEATHDL